jgi:hypothetical protein
MDEKQKEILAYLKRVQWAPMTLLEKEFSLSTTELSKTFAEMLSEIDVRIDRNIAHITIF